jgi:hypothetical protein
MAAEDAWISLIDAAKEKELDTFRLCLHAYARAVDEQFSLPAVEEALREDGLGVYLIAKQQEIAPNMTIVDLIGNAKKHFVLSIQLSAKPRRAKMAEGWPDTPEQNLERLGSAGFVQDCGVPLCNNCGELGHIRKVSRLEEPMFAGSRLTSPSTANKRFLSMSRSSLPFCAYTVRSPVTVLAIVPRSVSTHTPARTVSRRATTPRSALSLVQLRASSVASATRQAISPRM